jgi:hypothetical protein
MLKTVLYAKNHSGLKKYHIDYLLYASYDRYRYHYENPGPFEVLYSCEPTTKCRTKKKNPAAVCSFLRELRRWLL